MSNATFKLPETPAEIEAQLTDKEFLKDLHDRGPSAMQEYLAAYQKACADETNSALLDVRAAVKADMTETLKEFTENQKKVERPESFAVAGSADQATAGLGLPDHKAGTAFNPNALGAKIERKAKAEGYRTADFFKAAYYDKQFLKDFDRVNKLENDLKTFQAAYTSTVPADGGLLIPETLRSDIMVAALEETVTRSRANVVKMETPVIKYPTVQDTTHATSVFGGVIALWEDESPSQTETSAMFRSVKLEPKKLRHITSIPDDLLADAEALESFIKNVFPPAMAWYEDLAFIDGDGTGKPKGWKNASAAVTVAKEGSQAAATINSKNIFKMYSRLLPASQKNAVWVANIDCFPQLAELAVDVGTGGNTIWLHSAVEGTPSTLLGRPVIFTEKMETLGTAGDIMLVDLSKYLIGDRQQMQISSSAHDKFSQDAITFKVISRVDGRPWISNAVTPKKGAGELSPFVKLATRA